MERTPALVGGLAPQRTSRLWADPLVHEIGRGIDGRRSEKENGAE